jgi:hypothetical protein
MRLDGSSECLGLLHVVGTVVFKVVKIASAFTGSQSSAGDLKQLA